MVAAAAAAHVVSRNEQEAGNEIVDEKEGEDKDVSSPTGTTDEACASAVSERFGKCPPVWCAGLCCFFLCFCFGGKGHCVVSLMILKARISVCSIQPRTIFFVYLMYPLKTPSHQPPFELRVLLR